MSEGKKKPENKVNKDLKAENKPFKKKSQVPLAIRFVNPQILPWGLGLLLVYLIMVLITGSWKEGLVAQIIASIRLLILTLGIFYTFLGIIGFIYHPEDRSKVIPKWIRERLISKK